MTKKDLIGKRLIAGRRTYNIKNNPDKDYVCLYTGDTYYCSYRYEDLIHKVKSLQWNLLGARNIKLHEYLGK